MNLHIVIPSMNHKTVLGLLSDIRKSKGGGNIHVTVILQQTGEISNYDMYTRFAVCSKPLGLSAARNLGALNAGKKYVLFLDDDVRPPSEFFGSLREIIQKFEPDMVCGCLYQDESFKPYNRYSVTDRVEGLTFKDIDKICGAALLIKTELFRKLGGFDQRFGLGSKYNGMEDVDLFLRAVSQGYHVLRHHKFFLFHPSVQKEYSIIGACQRSYRNSTGTGALIRKHLLRRKMIKLAPIFALNIFKSLAAIISYFFMLNFRMSAVHLAAQFGKIIGFLQYDEHDIDPRWV